MDFNAYVSWIFSYKVKTAWHIGEQSEIENLFRRLRGFRGLTSRFDILDS